MSTELTVLTLAALWQVVQFVLMAVPANIEAGPRKTMGTRDNIDVNALLRPRTARLMRAFDNHNEGLLLFAIACLMVHLSGQSSGFTALCAYAYLAARVLYVPAYAFAWVPWRSVIWGVGLVATVAMLLAAL